MTTLQTTLQVLIVEDDPMMLLGLRQMLGEQPHLTVVGAASDGNAAVLMANQLAPDIVVMDLGLPYCDGITATQQIKAAAPATRIVMLTSHTTEAEVVSALSNGVDAYCVKGTQIDQLVRAIEAVADGDTYLDAQIAPQVIRSLSQPVDAVSPTIVTTLSGREREVLQLLVNGYSNPDIAKALFLSPNTVKTYVRSLMNKLAVNDRVQVAVVALRNGLVR
ncbi:response regulator transcription factor [Nodosilinea sp. LEGE 07088]|uniref:response regulator transcription factor n=1 Tax=Nodosilinea sp. LEGE 07088 TaxID=2777968 RepID=UPI0028BD7D98|nr:response regulator transcription factor [Nodosilinea sp. LEGE 07088]